MSVSELGIQILKHLGYGKASAVTAEKLCQVVGVPDRKLREVIRELIKDGHPVASSVNGIKGYYIANTPEEVQEYIAVTKSRLIQDAYRLRDFKRATRVIREPEQLVMTGLGR